MKNVPGVLTPRSDRIFPRDFFLGGLRIRVFRGCDLPETLSEPDQLKSCNAKFLRGMFEVPECDVFLCTGSSGDRMNAKFDQFGQERRNFGVLGLVTRVMQV